MNDKEKIDAAAEQELEGVPEHLKGEANAADLAARFGIDLRSRKFWEDSLAIVEKYVDRFCALVEQG